jgi:hypothetical protein
MGFSPPKDSENLSLEEKKNSYRNSQATNVLFDAMQLFMQSCLSTTLMRCWPKIQEKYDVSNII